VRLIDVMPTLLELAGVEIPEHAQGRSLSGVIDGRVVDEAPVLTEHILTWHRAEGEVAWSPHWIERSLRLGNWTLVERHSEALVEHALYDRRSDPGELIDLAQDGAHARTLERLRRRLDALCAASASTAARFSPPETFEVVEQELDVLRALGYAD
jgi:arylsulfatase A-like enzyme